MKITLVTACRNSAPTIRTALDSVLSQCDCTLEYLVIDGASTDGTVEILREYEPRFAGRMKWISEPDEGMYDALNKGIRLATGDFIGILNADDYLDGANVLARVSAFAAEANHAEIDCVFGNVRFVQKPGGRTLRVCFARFWRPWMLQWGYMPPHPAIFIRKTCFEKWGGYVGSRQEYRIAADCELLIRFFRVHGMRYRYMAVCTTAMLPGGTSTKNAAARWWLNKEIVKANRANHFLCCWPMLLPKYAVKVWEVILPRLGLSG
ncbi:MAG: glycosyltransferase family 2 protein [Kiritimatiellia bacterium]